MSPPAKASAQHHGVDFHGIKRKAGDARAGGLSSRLVLRSNPNLTVIFSHVGCTVHGLHGGVSKERHFVNRFDFLCGRRQRAFAVGFLARYRPWLFRGLGIKLSNRRAALLPVRSFIPGDCQRFARFLGRPVAIRYDRNSGADLHDMTYALDRLGLRRVEADDFSPETRTALHGRHEHSRDLGIDAVKRTPRDFVRRVQARYFLADETKLLGRLELGLLRYRKLGRLFGELAVSQFSATWLMGNDALFGAAFFRWNAPFLRRGSDQHLTAGRAQAAPVHQHAANAAARSEERR